MSNYYHDARITPSNLPRVLKFWKDFRQDTKNLADQEEALEAMRSNIEDRLKPLEEAAEVLGNEARRLRLQRDDPFGELSANPRGDNVQDSVGNNFILVCAEVVRNMRAPLKALDRHLQGLKLSNEVIHQMVDTPLFERMGTYGLASAQGYEDVQMVRTAYDMARPPLKTWFSSVANLDLIEENVIDCASSCYRIMAGYHKKLVNRHTVKGILIHDDPVTTDLAMSIYDNIDSAGEIGEGLNPEELSRYSMVQARILMRALTGSVISNLMMDPSEFGAFVKGNLEGLWGLAQQVRSVTLPIMLTMSSQGWFKGNFPLDQDRGRHFKQALQQIDALDPNGVTYRDKVGMLSNAEREALNFRNETLAEIVRLLKDETGEEEIIEYVLNRKKDRYVYERDVNSFYVCQIGSGSVWKGQAPGALEVVPGNKPNVTLDDVVGSGFDEVKDFFSSIGESAKWHNLFLATSPSKKVDKNNVLLIGPQGCGKTEILRAVASHTESIGIFAQASDFLTCWKGEAEKNPKRLFEAGMRIHKETNKPVFFLIDEIDTVLNGDRGQFAFGGTNLATEFQINMDGITEYPHLAVWGATNRPERIPMPLIRRFSKVVIVGELSQDDRVTLLKQFCSTLPIAEDFPEAEWEGAARTLEGAVGDIIRKVADDLWRRKITWLVNHHPDEAEKLAKSLTKEGSAFNVGDFDRGAFHKRLRAFVQVTPPDLQQAVEDIMSNVAIKAEIETAVATYERSRMVLAGIEG